MIFRHFMFEQNNSEDESKDKLAAELMIKSKEIRDITMKRNHFQQITENLYVWSFYFS